MTAEEMNIAYKVWSADPDNAPIIEFVRHQNALREVELQSRRGARQVSVRLVGVTTHGEASKRRDALLAACNGRGALLNELPAALNVSLATAYRDVETLERQGRCRVERVPGDFGRKRMRIYAK